LANSAPLLPGANLEAAMKSSLIICKNRGVALKVLLMLLMFSTQVVAGGPVAATLTVPSGNLKTVQIRNLPAGAMIQVQLECTGALLVAFVDSRAAQNRTRPLFATLLDRKASFTVTIPDTDDYYIVLDNRKGNVDQEVSLLVRAVNQAPGNGPLPSSQL
jgi:hypothetical protein